MPAGRLQPLKAIQNKCLRRITGGYKRTPVAALEGEAGVPPLDLYTEATALQRAASTKEHPVYRDIRAAVDSMWNQARRLDSNTNAARRRQGRRTPPPRPPTSLEKAQERAEDREREILAYLDHQREQRRRDGAPRRRRRRRERGRRGGPPKSLPITIWAGLEWRRRWTREARGKDGRNMEHPMAEETPVPV